MNKFIEESGEAGFILVSFGSAANMSAAPEELINVFINAFKTTNCRFIWKWDIARPNNLSSNVFTSKWIPQQRLLSNYDIAIF